MQIDCGVSWQTVNCYRETDLDFGFAGSRGEIVVKG